MSNTYKVEEYHISEIYNQEEKSACAREILGSLPDWFGNKESLEEYVKGVQEFPLWAALDEKGKYLGFFSVRIHYGHTGDIYVCGVRPECHHMGVGKALYERTEHFFLRKGCKYAMVETLSDKVNYEPYEKTRLFYESMGFEPLLTLDEMWDKDNLCLIMVKPLSMQALAAGMNRRFPEGNEPYQIVTRLLEECGEVANEVNRLEGSGTKVQRRGEGTKKELAGEIKDALNALNQLCLYYGAHRELAQAIDESLQSLRREGYVG
ncbi:MAG: GNAT family N-acetyltransferase [Butyrivibrio sp.]|nr:GNAT family N-acetyltransferase [Butyrivibrio sp.]